MAMFVHLAPESTLDRIRRNGIGRLRRSRGERPGGLFAVPVTRNFFISHQWLRELKRGGGGAIGGVYFRLRDDQPVWVGHYGQAHRQMTAAEAVPEFLRSDDRQGREVIVPRRIEAREIHRIRSLPQVLGWRFSPGAKRRPPFCVCSYCTRGEYGARRLRTPGRGRHNYRLQRNRRNRSRSLHPRPPLRPAEPGVRRLQNHMHRDELQSTVLPQFFPSAWLDGMPEIVFSKFPSRIRVGYVVREEGCYSYLLHERFDRLGMTLEEVHSLALRNLLQLPSARITFADVPGGAEGFITADDNFVAVRILLAEVRASFISKLGEEFLAILPHRDDCFCWSCGQPDDRQVRHVAEALEDFRQDDYRLTPDILLVNANGFRVYREQPHA